MSPVLRLAFADLRRRRLQAAVVALVVLLASLAGTTALTLLSEADAPYDRAFADASGAHLVIRYDTSRASMPALAATASLPVVAAIAGPWQEVTGLAVAGPAGSGGALDLVGRPSAGGPVDRLQVLEGRWAASPGEIVLGRRAARDLGHALGDQIAVSPDQGVDSLTVVGIAAAVNDSADGWVTPAQAAAIHRPGAKAGGPQPSGAIVYYRLHSASTSAEISAATQQLTAALPSGAVADVTSWLDQKLNADRTIAVMVPFLLAFSAFALLAAAMIVGNVVSGAVIAGYRAIGIMKSVGFTPAQVIATLAVQMLVPAAAGAGLGIAGGVAASQPFLADTAAAFDLPQSSGAVPWVIGTCLAAVLAVVLVATLVPGWRAGRMSAAWAIATGSAPRAGRSLPGAGSLAGLRLPREISLGIQDALARPVRSAMTLLAVAIGVATITFSTGLTRSLTLVEHALAHDQTVQVIVVRDSGGVKDSLAPAMTDRQVTDLIRHQAGTARLTSFYNLPVHVDGMGPSAVLFAYRGDASWIGYQVLSGRWFTAPGEAVVPQAFLDAARKRVGDTVTIHAGNRTEVLRIVGTSFDQQGDNLLLRAGWPAATKLDPNLEPRTYEVQVAGVDVRQYARSLETAVAPAPVGVELTGGRGIDTAFLLIEGVLAGLALVLTLMALAGVFNTVVLNTRERARDTAILKSLGMTPRQAVSMVVTSVAVIGLAGSGLAIPVGEAMQRQILTLMGRIAASTPVPEPFFNVYPAALLAGLAAAGLVVALAGAWLPAGWAARSRISEVLATE